MIEKILLTIAFTLFLIVLSFADFSPDTDLSEASASFLGEEAHDNAGRSLSIVKDVNGDGYDDILIGANDNGRGGTQAGQAYLIFGKQDGWAMDTDLAASDASFVGEDDYNLTGWSVSAAGDVNGDEYGDFLIGAPAFLSEDNPGSVYLIWGKPSGWSMYTDLASADVVLRGTNIGDKAGFCVSDAGDVNADGYADFLVGAYSNSAMGSESGQAYLIMGKATGWQKDVEISSITTASFWGEAEGDQAGTYVAAAGDVNADHYDDFLIGAIGNDEAGTDAGQVYLFLGKGTGWQKNINLSQADASFIGEAAGDNAGNAMAGAGDVNGDGYDDILIAAYYNGENGYLAGQVYLILGKPTGWHKDTPLSQSDASFWGEYLDDRAGKSLSTAGDLNDDGYDDFLIGAYGNDDGGEHAGKAYLILGKATDWSMDFPLSQSDASFWGENADDRAGRAVSGTGDVNGDGFNDMLIGAYACDESGLDAGQAYLLLDNYIPAPTVSLTSPNGGEDWTVGTVQNITWISTGLLPNVKLEYSPDSGTNWTTIIANTPNDGTEPWTIPDNPSANYLVRVAAIDGSPTDQSDAVFAISAAGVITVISPNGGEMWQMGSVHDITWTSSNTSGNVNIEYSNDAGNTWSSIANNEPDGGIFAWKVPHEITMSCLVRIMDCEGIPSDTSDNVFRIVEPFYTLTMAIDPEVSGTTDPAVGDHTYNEDTVVTIIATPITGYDFVNWTGDVADPTNDTSTVTINANKTVTANFQPSLTFITVTAPSGGEDWEVDTIHNITWTSQNTSGTVKLEYSTNNWITSKQIIASTADDGVFEWTIPNDPSATCLVKLADTDDIASDQSNAVFTISAAPLITVTAPNGGEDWTVGSAHDINWTSNKTSGTVKIEYSANNGSSWNEIVASTTDAESYSWTIPSEPSTSCLVRLTDTDGSPSDVSDTVFTISQISYTLAMATNPVSSGVTDPVAGNHNYPKGTVVNISTTATTGYQFASWTGDVADPNSDTTKVTMNADKTVIANFSLIPITDVHASIQDETILLEWSPSLVAMIYNVYRDTVYNFSTDTLNGTNRIGYHLSDQNPEKNGVQWTDTGNGADIVGDVSKNYFYKVTAVAAVESAPSNVAAEFDYNLITTSSTDINEIVVILDTKNTVVPITTAEALAQAIPNCSDVFYWDAAGQGTVGHVKGLPFNNFAISPGYPYIVNVTAPTVWSTAGAYVTPSFDLITTNGTDINQIGVPLEKTSLTTAAILGQDIPGCTDVFYWDPNGQGTVGHVVGLPFDNFSVRAGYPYYVNVTAPTVWPASSGSLFKAESCRPIKNIRPGGKVPHTVYGKLSYEAGIDGKANQLQIRAWITDRPEEVLTSETIGVGCDESYWWVGVSNFVTDWAVGESLYVEVTAADERLRGKTAVLLSNAGSDRGNTIQLSKATHDPAKQMQELSRKFVTQPKYLNPFDSEKTISFGLPGSGIVTIQIFNLSDRWIRTIVAKVL